MHRTKGCFAVALLACALSGGARAEGPYFEKYILKAVEQLAATRPAMGYANHSYTEDLQLGNIRLAATKSPFTMCVAAQIEVIVTALNLYSKDTDDASPQSFLPDVQWRAIRGRSFRGMVWIADRQSSRGTAHALTTFGMGKEHDYSDLVPGAFVNLNRTNKTGHAVVFLGYIDEQGTVLDKFSDAAKGFKYFSSQGTAQNGGFGYRYAFFERHGCPVLASGMKRDCGLIYSKNPAMLNAGRMFSPSFWKSDVRDAALKADAAAPRGFEFDAEYFDGKTTDD